jgi:glycosyltransferase involved in cell wall biosynthesis
MTTRLPGTGMEVAPGKRMTLPVPISIVVPVLDEAANIEPLVEGIRLVLGPAAPWEVLFVDDGSTDGTAEQVLSLAAADTRIRLLQLARNYGQTAALQAGFDHARGKIIVSMDGDLQNDPADIPALVAKLEEGYDLVVGYRVRRRDPWLTRRLPSRVANKLAARITGVPIQDNGCTLKAYRRALVDRLALYADLHRFIPALAVATAGARIAQVPVRHHPRRFGRSKYGLARVGQVLVDLLILKMIRSFRERPLALFGTAAVAATLVGFVFAAAAFVIVMKAGLGSEIHYVLPVAACLWLALAFYLVMLGLLAEAALREARADEVEPVPLSRLG